MCPNGAYGHLARVVVVLLLADEILLRQLKTEVKIVRENCFGKENAVKYHRVQDKITEQEPKVSTIFGRL